VLWFNREAFDQLLAWMLTIAAVSISAGDERSPKEIAQAIASCYGLIEKLQRASESSDFQVVKLMEAVRAQPSPDRRGSK
jgi:hypothetical protein